ncbi:MAG: phage tail protein, partial [Pseudodesulfovibrio sp.]|uniref:phage tail protein n=1 Tax=Pseudodesulfovibrio sp. TaxID=2035812 RepID=UPI003D108CCE
RRIVYFTTKDLDKAAYEISLLLSALPGMLRTAGVRAINKTSVNVRTDVIREVREEYNFPAKALREGVTLQRATMGKPSGGVLGIEERATPLIRFGGRPSKSVSDGGRRPAKGPTVLVKRAEGRKVVKGAFAARPQSGGDVSYYVRQDDAPRYPIRKLFGPRYMSILQDAQAWDARERTARQRLAANLYREASYLLQQVGLR